MGIPHPDYLDAVLSSKQLTDWIAYSLLEPFGSRREDARAGTIAATVVNMQKGKNAQSVSANDFFPEFTPSKEKEDQSKKAILAQQSFFAQSIPGVKKSSKDKAS